MFERLARDVLPTLLSGRSRSRSFRGWCAGCANGEEVYSLAILVEEIVRRRHGRFSVMIHGTDLDDKAVRTARAGLYNESVLSEIPHGYLKTYFDRTGDDYAVREDVRRHVHFSRYDLTSRRLSLRRAASSPTTISSSAETSSSTTIFPCRKGS